MKKLFFFAATLLATGSMMAKQTTVTPGKDAISTAIGTATAGDMLVLSTGEYSESVKLSVDKALTFMAAPEAKPVVAFSNSSENFRFKASVEMIGLEVTYDNAGYVVRTGADFANMIFRKCYFHGGSGPLVYTSSNTIDNVIIEDCMFSDCTRETGGAFSCTTGKIKNFKMTNSTVYNVSGVKAIQVNKCDDAVIDHCTFYSNGQDAIFVGTVEVSCAVSNCIVYGLSTTTPGNCINTAGGTVSNCMYYSTAEGPNTAEGAVTVTNCTNEDPLFMDAPKGNFQLKKTSPAIGAGTDKSNLGDPRWGVEGPGTGIIEAAAAKTAKKMMIDGKMMIMRDGKAYNVLGF